MDKFEITYHRYDCHPETCNHNNHNPWWIRNVYNLNVLAKFRTKAEAISFCEENELTYSIKLPQW